MLLTVLYSLPAKSAAIAAALSMGSLALGPTNAFISTSSARPSTAGRGSTAVYQVATEASTVDSSTVTEMQVGSSVTSAAVLPMKLPDQIQKAAAQIQSAMAENALKSEFELPQIAWFMSLLQKFRLDIPKWPQLHVSHDSKMRYDSRIQSIKQLANRYLQLLKAKHSLSKQEMHEMNEFVIKHLGVLPGDLEYKIQFILEFASLNANDIVNRLAHYMPYAQEQVLEATRMIFNVKAPRIDAIIHTIMEIHEIYLKNQFQAISNEAQMYLDHPESEGLDVFLDKHVGVSQFTPIDQLQQIIKFANYLKDLNITPFYIALNDAFDLIYGSHPVWQIENMTVAEAQNLKQLILDTLLLLDNDSIALLERGRKHDFCIDFWNSNEKSL
eukprot:NODE_1178_length_1892_cov_0.397658.p1 type:complete len:385 gc:universal NODE_1178_length_1892_cov_0.397658:1774-620(-)